jgi:hypothetical protein
MLSKCANPECPRAFLYLSKGKLFRLRIPSDESREPERMTPINNPSSRDRNEFFWLCDSCSERLTVVWKKGIGVRAVPVMQQYRAAS